MIKLYIQVVDGQPVNHPAFEENLLSAFGCIPDGWEQFMRLEVPPLGPYQKIDQEGQITYQKQEFEEGEMINVYWTDIHPIIEYTEEEKRVKQEAIKDAWANRPFASNFTAWTLNEEKCMMVPPVEYPYADERPGKCFKWSGPQNNWIEVDIPPDLDSSYRFNHLEWKWEKIPDPQ